MNGYQTESQYLLEVLTSYGKNMDSKLVDFYRGRTNTLKQFIADHYRTMLAGPPIYSGSIHRSTDIITEFDVDIIVPFKKEAFKNQKSMLQKMNRFLSSEVMSELRNASQFRKQRVSGGVRFENFWGTSEIWVDVVPGIEPRKGEHGKSPSMGQKR